MLLEEGALYLKARFLVLLLILVSSGFFRAVHIAKRKRTSSSLFAFLLTLGVWPGSGATDMETGLQLPGSRQAGVHAWQSFPPQVSRDGMPLGGRGWAAVSCLGTVSQLLQVP